MANTNWLQLGLLAGIGYGLYRFFSKSGPGGQAADAASTAVANAYVGLTNWLYGSVTTVPTGNVILPSGQKIPLASVHVTWDTANNVASFVYEGYGYIIAPNPSGGPAYDQNGDYHAQ